jgi:PadR family transcriptional regulator PadR
MPVRVIGKVLASTECFKKPYSLETNRGDQFSGRERIPNLGVPRVPSVPGFAVSQRLKQVSGDVLQVSDGSLYPALHKLEQEGWITAEWKTTESGRRAKYYSLTRLGWRQFEKEADNWGRLSSAISRVIKLSGDSRRSSTKKLGSTVSSI